VLGFTLTLATEGLKDGVHVNGFSPRIATRMSSPEVMAHVYDKPKEAFATNMARFTTELSSPAAIYLAHDSCPFNGVLLASGGGQVMRVALMENEGLVSDDVSVESIAAHAEQILDMSQAVHFGVGGKASASSASAKAPAGAH
jgi:hypothetical protein